MITRHVDILPASPAVSALVRRIAFKLDAEMRFNGHGGLSQTDRAALFNLGDASVALDRICQLPSMENHENHARRDLLELYEIFSQCAPYDGERQ